MYIYVYVIIYIGKFVEYVHLHTAGQPDVKAEDICQALVAVAMRDIQGVSNKACV